jgi:tyrosine-protein phosphatase YwqE
MNIHVIILVEHDRSPHDLDIEMLRPVEKQGLEQLIAFLRSGIGIWTMEIKEFDRCADNVKWFSKEGNKIDE